MTNEEKTEIQSLLDRAQSKIAVDYSPDGRAKPNARARAFDPPL
jgi:hypothetical protein